MKREKQFRSFASFLILLPFAPALGAHDGKAGSATWNLNSLSTDWLLANNWTPASFPNAPEVVATL